MYDLAIKGNADFIFGSRYMDDALSDDDTIVTFIGNKIFTFIGKIFFIVLRIIFVFNLLTSTILDG